MTSRYELKFPVTAEQRRSILAGAGDAILLDAHGVEGRYRVVSHYFDTCDLDAYWRKIDGEAIRSKVRLRYYLPPIQHATEPSCGYLEIKRRIHSAIVKNRVRVTREGLRAILADATAIRRLSEFAIGPCEDHGTTIAELIRATYRPHLVPTTVVSYLREAWTGAIDRRLRLTFDSLCMGHPATDVPLMEFTHGRVLLSSPRLLMEVKIDHAIPRWLRDLLVQQKVRQERFSKYATSVEVLGLVHGRPTIGVDESADDIAPQDEAAATLADEQTLVASLPTANTHFAEPDTARAAR